MSILGFLVNNLFIFFLAFKKLKINEIPIWLAVFETVFAIFIFVSFIIKYRENKKLSWQKVVGKTTRQTIILFLSSFTVAFVPVFIVCYFVSRRRVINYPKKLFLDFFYTLFTNKINLIFFTIICFGNFCLFLAWLNKFNLAEASGLILLVEFAAILYLYVSLWENVIRKEGYRLCDKFYKKILFFVEVFLRNIILTPIIYLATFVAVPLGLIAFFVILALEKNKDA